MVTEVAQRNGTPLKKCKHIRKIQMNSMNRLGNHGLPVQTKEIKSLSLSTNTLAKMRSTQIMDGRARASIKNNCMIRNIRKKCRKILVIITTVMDSSKQKRIPNGGTTEMVEELKSGMPLKKLLGSVIIRHTSKSSQDNHGYPA